jgi:hypothetical protein
MASGFLPSLHLSPVTCNLFPMFYGTFFSFLGIRRQERLEKQPLERPDEEFVTR